MSTVQMVGWLALVVGGWVGLTRLSRWLAPAGEPSLAGVWRALRSRGELPDPVDEHAATAMAALTPNALLPVCGDRPLSAQDRAAWAELERVFGDPAFIPPHERPPVVPGTTPARLCGLCRDFRDCDYRTHPQWCECECNHQT